MSDYKFIIDSESSVEIMDNIEARYGNKHVLSAKIKTYRPDSIVARRRFDSYIKGVENGKRLAVVIPGFHIILIPRWIDRIRLGDVKTLEVLNQMSSYFVKYKIEDYGSHIRASSKYYKDITEEEYKALQEQGKIWDDRLFSPKNILYGLLVLLVVGFLAFAALKWGGQVLLFILCAIAFIPILF